MDLRNALGLGIEVDGPNGGFAISGHSTSLVHRSVSAINPRIIFVHNDSKTRDVTAMAFARGERFSEIVVRERSGGGLQFYLAVFTLACDDAVDGCGPGDLLTEEVESGWTGFDVYGEEDLKNTPLDCRTCHQPDGPLTPKLLRMQELEAPWNHWFYRLSEGGRALLRDYRAAKGNESFAGLGGNVDDAQPGMLSFALFNASPPQHNVFDSRKIQQEVMLSAAERGVQQPVDNSVPGNSASWRRIYERARAGKAISVPYHDVKVTDPDKLASMTAAYADYRAGVLASKELPDIREVFPDDPERRAHMGLVTEPGLSGEEVLTQACAQCHNERLDQTISRARFDVDLSSTDDEVKARAIDRIKLPLSDPAVMPPARFRRLSEQGRERLIELLSR